MVAITKWIKEMAEARLMGSRESNDNNSGEDNLGEGAFQRNTIGDPPEKGRKK